MHAKPFSKNKNVNQKLFHTHQETGNDYVEGNWDKIKWLEWQYADSRFGNKTLSKSPKWLSCSSNVMIFMLVITDISGVFWGRSLSCITRAYSR